MVRSKSSFKEDLRKGDILISSSNQVTGLIGHAAIMATDYWVLEMPGDTGSSSSSSSFSFGGWLNPFASNLNDNNRRISKSRWYNEHTSDVIKVYRCPDRKIAKMAANWAYTHYYNRDLGGEEKTIHIRYSLVSPFMHVTNPSYCSKLVLQSYMYGTGDASVISPLALMNAATGTAIVPTTIPTYFTEDYALDFVGEY